MSLWRSGQTSSPCRFLIPGVFSNRVCVPVPRAGPRNMRVYDATTSSLTIGWDHAEGPVRQYRIAYAPMTGDPITEFVSSAFCLGLETGIDKNPKGRPAVLVLLAEPGPGSRRRSLS